MGPNISLGMVKNLSLSLSNLSIRRIPTIGARADDCRTGTHIWHRIGLAGWGYLGYFTGVFSIQLL